MMSHLLARLRCTPLLDVRPRHGSKLVSLPMCEHSIIPKHWIALAASFRVKLFASRSLLSMPTLSAASNSPVERARRDALDLPITQETPRSGRNGLLDVRPRYGHLLLNLRQGACCQRTLLPLSQATILRDSVYSIPITQH